MNMEQTPKNMGMKYTPEQLARKLAEMAAPRLPIKKEGEVETEQEREQRIQQETQAGINITLNKKDQPKGPETMH